MAVFPPTWPPRTEYLLVFILSRTTSSCSHNLQTCCARHPFQEHCLPSCWFSHGRNDFRLDSSSRFTRYRKTSPTFRFFHGCVLQQFQDMEPTVSHDVPCGVPDDIVGVQLALQPNTCVETHSEIHRHVFRDFFVEASS